ncbi:monoheme cytochrome C [Litoribaculum gwangyangense]|uniref:Monoheme cytochrome C n=1 Tax=Litoribaculum gwangyangense TaxID=1130722 RepID=A0ABP9CGG6_9FLAO
MSQNEDFHKGIKKIYHQLMLLFSLFIIAGALLVLYVVNPGFFANKTGVNTYVATETIELDEDRIENGIHVRTGLIDAEGLMTVVNNCTNCHSAKLVTQNRMSKERWNATIRWMQETQNLWDLGKNQDIIVNYLVTNYPIEEVGRRANLINIDWYELED